MRRLFVLLPCFNEEENIARLAKKWEEIRFPLLHEQQLLLQLVFINDGSTDRTKNEIEKLQETDTSCVYLERVKNAGLGEAMKMGLCYFVRNGHKDDYAVVMDADNSHAPALVFPMLAANQANEKCCVIASRYCQESVTTGVPAYRCFLSAAARWFYTAMLRVPQVRDYTCGYRLYPYAVIHNLIQRQPERFITQRSFACMMELLVNLHLSGAVFREVPMELRYDLKRGSSKMKIINTIHHSLKEAIRLRGCMRSRRAM